MSLSPPEPRPGGTADPVAGDGNVADFSSESVIIFDRDGVIRYWNPASEALYGWPALMVVGQDARVLTANGRAHAEHWRRLLQEGTWEGPVRRRTATGSAITAVVRQTVRCDAQGVPQDIVEYGRRDVADPDRPLGIENHPDRFTAACWELDVASVRPLLRAIAAERRAGGAGMAVEHARWDDTLLTGTRVVDVNERTVRLVGGHAGRANMIGRSVAAFWPIESRAVLAELIVEVATSGEQGESWRRQLASDGILRDPVVTVWRADDRPDTLFVAVHGGADDDRSFWYLRASEERYRKLIDHLPTALWQVDASHIARLYAEIRAGGVTDFDGYLDAHPELLAFAGRTVRVREVNASAVQLFGGRSMADLIRPVAYLFAASPNALRRVMVARFDGRRSHSEAMRIQTLDGRLLDVQLSVIYPSPPTELDVTIISMDNITERLQTEAQLRQIQADFAHAARISTLGELTTSIAHEVNQPLSAIVTNAETSLRWLSRPDPNIGKVEQLTARIAASARRANDIVQRIRGMAAKHRPEPAALDLGAVAREALMFIRHEIETRSIEVETRFFPLLPSVIGDRVQLQQVIVNLLINSVQAIDQGGRGERRIRLGTELDADGGILFWISDSGPGIAEENLDRIFEGFFTTKEAGMGIGLAICQSIIAEHGGRIVAHTLAEGGAMLRFTLPPRPAG